MKLDILCILFIGYFLHASFAAKDKDAHVKVQVPELIQKHTHHHNVYRSSPNAYDTHDYHNYNDGRNDHLTAINHPHNPEQDITQQHAYNPEKKHKPKNKKAGKKKSKKQKKKKYGDDQDFKEILNNYEKKPEENEDFSNDGAFKKSFHTEHYEVKKINPNARHPDEKYIIEGAYKVQETDPWGHPTTSFEKYNSPVGKIAASIISKYDYVNFRPGETDEFSKEKEEQNDHGNVEFDGKDDSYVSYENNKKNPQGYNDAPKYNKENYDYTPHYDDGYRNEKKSQAHPAPINYNDNNQGGKIVQIITYVPKVENNNNGKNYEKSAGYNEFLHEKDAYEGPFNEPVVHAHQNHHAKPVNQENKNQKIQVFIVPTETYGNFKSDDTKPIGNLQKKPAVVEYISPHDHERVKSDIEYEIAKEFGHIVDPGHSSDSHHDYDSDWEKHLIDYLYG